MALLGLLREQCRCTAWVCTILQPDPSQDVGCMQVPTILVYNKDGVEVSRLVSSDPGDLVGFIIDLSSKLGFKLPSKV